MSSQLIPVVMAVMAAVMMCEAQGPGNWGGNRFGRRPRGPGDAQGPRGQVGRLLENMERYSWERLLADGTTVEESAFKPPNRDGFIYRSTDPALKEQNMARTMAIYAFGADSNVVALRPFVPRSPCLLLDTALTLQGTQAELEVRNNSLTPVETTLSAVLNGTLPPLDAQAKDALFEGKPGLGRFCGGRPVVVTIPQVGTPDASQDIREVNVLTMDGQLTLIIPGLTNAELPGGFGRGRGGRGQRGEGQGGEGQGRGRGGLLGQGLGRLFAEGRGRGIRGENLA